MKEPRLQMRLKKQLSGGRVPHLLWGQTRPHRVRQGALSGGTGVCAWLPPQDTLLDCPGGVSAQLCLCSQAEAAHLTRGM